MWRWCNTCADYMHCKGAGLKRGLVEWKFGAGYVRQAMCYWVCSCLCGCLAAGAVVHSGFMRLLRASLSTCMLSGWYPPRTVVPSDMCVSV